MKSLIFLCLVSIISQAVYAAPSDKVDCSKVEEALDELGSLQANTFLNDKHKPPTTVEAVAKRCVEMNDAIKSLRRYNKECYSSLTQQVLSAILRTRSEYLDTICKDQTTAESKAALEGAKCVVENANEKATNAERQALVSFEVIQEAPITDDKVRIRRVCCAILDSKKHALAAINEKCAKHEKVFANYMDSYTEEAMGLICPAVDKLECEKLEAIKTEGVAPKSKFLLTPLVKLVKSLDH